MVDKCIVILRGNPGEESVMNTRLNILGLLSSYFNPCGRSISNKIDCGQLQSQTKNVVTQNKRNFDIKVHNKYN